MAITLFLFCIQKTITMNKNILLLIFITGQTTCLWAQDLKVPEFRDEPVPIMSDGSLGKLEKSAGDSRSSSAEAYRPTGFGGSVNMQYAIYPDAHSNIKLSTDTRFVIKLSDAEVDPESLIYLTKATTRKNTRIVYTTKTYGAGTADLFITCDFEKLAPGVYRITPKNLKPATDYGFVFRKSPSGQAVVFLFATN